MRGKRLSASVLMVVLFIFMISCGSENTSTPSNETTESAVVSGFAENSADSSMVPVEEEEAIEDESLALQTEDESPEGEIMKELPKEEIEELSEEETDYSAWI